MSIDTAARIALASSISTLAAVALGAIMLGSHDAEAQESVRYTSCFFAQQESVDVNDEAIVTTPPRHRLIIVPAGWEVVGGAGSSVNGHPTILFCRR